jgi:hypothetical protein
MMPNPWVILGAIAAALIVYTTGHHAGYAQKEAEDLAMIAEKNREMQTKKDEQDAKDADTKQEFETKLSSVLASRPRLFVPTKGGCATATGNDGQARAELDGQTVEDLIRLVAEGDRAIIELNSCIDRYNQVRDTLK